jgi:hypothetical protein
MPSMRIENKGLTAVNLFLRVLDLGFRGLDALKTRPHCETAP